MRFFKTLFIAPLLLLGFHVKGITPNFEDISSQIYNSQHDFHATKNDEYSPLLETHKNTGAFRTNFHISYPPNSLQLSKLSWLYDSMDSKDRSFGKGWRLNLPRIEKFLGYNNSNSKIKFRGYGPQVSGEYVKTQEDLSVLESHIKALTSSVEAKNLSFERLEAYRPLIDTSFQILLHDRSSEYTLVIQTGGRGHLFNNHGQLILVSDQFDNQIEFQWNHNLLKKISYQYWQIDFEYLLSSELNSPFISILGNEVHTDKKHLNSINLNSLNTNASKLYEFEIDEGYLNQVSITDHNETEVIFKGSYSKVVPDLDRNGLDTSNFQDSVAYYKNSIDQIEWDDPGPRGEYTISIDLTGNILSDKIVFD